MRLLLTMCLVAIATTSLSDKHSIILEKTVDSFVSNAKGAEPEMAAAIFCASALGYLACNNKVKAKDIYQKLVSSGAESIAWMTPIFTNGTLTTKCLFCVGTGSIRTACVRCGGKGSAEMLKGTTARCLLCTGKGFQLFQCLRCEGAGCLNPDPLVCTAICSRIIKALAAGREITEEELHSIIVHAVYDDDNPGEELVMGVPRNIFVNIRLKAEKEWPDDFRMQKYTIESEIDAYKELQALPALRR